MRTADQTWYGARGTQEAYRAKHTKSTITDALLLCAGVYAVIFSMVLIIHVLW